MPAINENLKLLRQARGMTQAEVADLISVTRQTVSSYEAGRTQPDLETLKRLAEVYQADLHDVLYGGDRLQRRIARLRRAALILTAVLLLGILARSILLLTVNKFFAVQPGAVIEENLRLIETRFALITVADAVVGVSTAVYILGCVVIIYPAITVAHVLKTHKLLIFFFATVAAILACTIPFAAADKIYTPVDYIWSMWNALAVLLLSAAVILSAKLIKRRRMKQ